MGGTSPPWATLLFRFFEGTLAPAVAAPAVTARWLGKVTNLTTSNYPSKLVRMIEIEGRGRGNVIISESGLYKLVMRSDKPQARSFQDWVTREVLATIRKDGMYVAGEEKRKTGKVSDDKLTLLGHGAP